MYISEEIITSRQNKSVSLAAGLENRKQREREGLFRFDGYKLFVEAVQKGVKIDRVFLRQSESGKWLSLMSEHEAALNEASVLLLADSLFDRLSTERAPEGILTVAGRPEIHAPLGAASAAKLAELSADKEKRIFLLESIRDPGNMGTILRSAAAFGADLVVISSDCADLLNPKTVRGAMGAIFRQPTAVFSELSEAIGILKQNGRRVLGAALDREALALSKSVLRAGDCLVVGNEGHGLSAGTLAACDEKLFIPMEKDSESLNAAIAASVLLWSMYSGF